MELNDDNLPVTAAAKILAKKKNFPTALDTAGIRELDPEFVRLANFSAQTTMESLLDVYKDLLTDMVSPPIEQRADRVTETNPEGNVTTGPSMAKAREEIKAHLDDIGYSPDEGTAGTILDLSSFERIMLKLETDTAMAFGAGRFVKQNADPLVVSAYPGLELERTMVPRGGVDAERNWGARWLAAAAEADDDEAAAAFRKTGRMVALKSSGIWQALGDGAGGYDDTLGNPYDPLAFNTYMRQFEVSREECEELGLLDEGEEARPAAFDLGSLFANDAIMNRVTGRTMITNSGPPDEARDEDGRWSETGAGKALVNKSGEITKGPQRMIGHTIADEGEYFHATAASNADSILKHGIRPTDKTLGFKAAFVGKNKDLAFAYGAGSAAEHGEKEVAMVVVKNDGNAGMFSPRGAKNIAYSPGGIKPENIDRIEFYRAEAAKDEAPLRVIKPERNKFRAPL